MSNIKVGSVCSGIEAASVAWSDLGYEFEWFSEISAFPSKLLNVKYPNIPNMGDMRKLPQMIAEQSVFAPDLICGGTPCQAFSLAGWKKGLEDARGNLTLKFVDIINANDDVRLKINKPRTIVLWENVEGVLRDKTNAFGCLLASLAGYEDEIELHQKWPQAGLIRGPLRNVAWRVLDAKYFGVPQQRKRLYLMAGGREFNPEDVLFEVDSIEPTLARDAAPLRFGKNGHSIEVFRAYTDCLYSAYGTKWNGNAAAHNGSLFVLQNERIRRLTPLECERLMGFPDNYTNLTDVKMTSRYQAVGNSWAVPVVKWLGKRLRRYYEGLEMEVFEHIPKHLKVRALRHIDMWSIGKDPVSLGEGHFLSTLALDGERFLNGSIFPCHQMQGDIKDIIDVCAEEKLYLTPVGCKGILRRKEERQLSMNVRLEDVLRQIASEWSDEAIEAVSRVQSRGRFSSKLMAVEKSVTRKTAMPLWEE